LLSPPDDGWSEDDLLGQDGDTDDEQDGGFVGGYFKLLGLK
jgi:hypothetical protein